MMKPRDDRSFYFVLGAAWAAGTIASLVLLALVCVYVRGLPL